MSDHGAIPSLHSRVAETEVGAEPAPRPPMPAPTAKLDGSEAIRPFSVLQLGYLLLCTGLAAGMRLFRLESWAFWIDEAHTFRDVVAPAEVFWQSGISKYPLYFLVLRWAAELFQLGPLDLSEALMRLPAVFFGIASVPALAVVARNMVGRRAALLAALLLAISPWHLYWSQNARFYSMVMFFSLTGMGALFHGHERKSWWLMLLGACLFFLGGYSHPSAYLIAAAALVYVLAASFLRREEYGHPDWLPLVVVLLLAVLVVASLPILQRVWEVKRPVFSLFHLVQTLVFYVGIPVLVAGVGGMLLLYERGARAALFLTCMVVVPLLTLIVLSFIGFQRLTAQYAFGILPALYLLTSVLIIALVQVFRGTGVRAWVLRLVPLAIVVVHMAGQDYMYFFKQYGWRPRFDDAVAYVKTHHTRLHPRRDLVVVTTNGPSVRYYLDAEAYGNPRAHPQRVEVKTIEEWDVQASHVGYLESLVFEARKENQDLWVIVTEPELDEKDSNSQLDVFLRWNLRQVRRLPNWTGPKDMVVLIYHLQ